MTLVHVSKYIQDAKKKHTTDLEVQMRYNEANDKSIGRQTEKVKDMEDTCRMIMHDIRSAMEEDPQPPARKNSEDELRAKVVTDVESAGRRNSTINTFTRTMHQRHLPEQPDNLTENA